MTWAEIAERFGTAAHARMEWEAITQRAPMDHSPEPGVFDRAPEQGQLPEELVEPTVQILRRYTTTPELCHFAFWYGYGDLPADVRAGAAFSVPGRTYHLCHGSVDDARGFHWTDTEGFSGFYRADSWWPDDRCWFVGSDTDLDSTYVGGSAALVAEVVADPALEAHEVSPDTHFAHRGDDVNV